MPGQLGHTGGGVGQGTCSWITGWKMIGAQRMDGHGLHFFFSGLLLLHFFFANWFWVRTHEPPSTELNDLSVGIIEKYTLLLSQKLRVPSDMVFNLVSIMPFSA